MNRSRFHELWTEHLDGPLTAADDQSAQAWLSDDFELRRAALRDAELHGLLRSMSQIRATEDQFVDRVTRLLVQSEAATPLPPTPPVASSAAPSSPREAILPPPPPPVNMRRPEPPPVAVPAITAPPVADPPPRHAGRKSPLWGLVACAAVLLVVAGIGALRWHTDKHATAPLADDREVAPSVEPRAESQSPTTTHQFAKDDVRLDPLPEIVPPAPRVVERPKPDRSPRELVDVPSPPSASDPLPLLPDDRRTPEPSSLANAGLARIVEEHGAVWEYPRQDAVLRAEPVSLLEGTATIELAGGAQVVVRGPADLRFESANGLELTRGHLSARVPSQAVGFAVKTPSSQVVDLGTEFVVDVEDGGATAVHVVRGEVEVSTTGRGDDRSWQLSSGQFKWVPRDSDQDLDWRMVVTLDEKTFQGQWYLNGQEQSFDKVEEFLTHYPNMIRELHQLRRLIPADRRARDSTPFRAELTLNGQRAIVSSTSEYTRAIRQFNDRLTQLWKDALLRGSGTAGGVFQGSFHWNGTEFRFQGLESWQAFQEELQRRTASDLLPATLPDTDK